MGDEAESLSSSVHFGVQTWETFGWGNAVTAPTQMEGTEGVALPPGATLHQVQNSGFWLDPG